MGAFPAQDDDNEIDSSPGGDDLDYENILVDSLSAIGERLFGNPDQTSGELVSQWKPDSAINPEEVGNYYEGDILHIPNLARNGLKSLSSRWPKGVVPYEIGGYFRPEEKEVIKAAIADYHKLTCIKFVPRAASDRDYIYFNNGNTGCWSSVGRVGGRQEVNLQSGGCLSKKGTVEHEIMHALGFLHEQNRADRDQFITVNYHNIQSGRENNFEKAKKDYADALGVAYDYRSVMHYSPNSFSRNNQPTIEAKQKGVTMGQREGLSRKDIQKIKRMYKCGKK